MATAAPKPCVKCGVLVRDGTGRCDKHKLLGTGRFGDPTRGSRHKRGYDWAWVKKREAILRRDNGLCQPCLEAHRVTSGNDVDHKVPKAEGGSDDDSNLQTICDDCHKTKRAREAMRGRGV